MGLSVRLPSADQLRESGRRLTDEHLTSPKRERGISGQHASEDPDVIPIG